MGDVKSSRSTWLLQEIDRLLAEIDAVLEGNDEQRPARQATQIPLAPPKSAPPRRVVSPLEVVTAYHEAGHAVVARYSGVTVKELTIVPRLPRYLGYVRTAPSSGNLAETGGSGDYWHRLERDGSAYLLFLLGGAVAEQIKFGKWVRNGCQNDLRQFHVVVQGLVRDRPGPVGDNDIERPDRAAAGSTIAAERKQCWERVHQILNQPEMWAWVEAVTEAALERGTLTGAEIDALRPTVGS
jgi:hypothetical protein